MSGAHPPGRARIATPRRTGRPLPAHRAGHPVVERDPGSGRAALCSPLPRPAAWTLAARPSDFPGTLGLSLLYWRTYALPDLGGNGDLTLAEVVAVADQ